MQIKNAQFVETAEKKNEFIYSLIKRGRNYWKLTVQKPSSSQYRITRAWSVIILMQEVAKGLIRCGQMSEFFGLLAKSDVPW